MDEKKKKKKNKTKKNKQTKKNKKTYQMLARRNLSHVAYFVQYQYVYLQAGLYLTTLSINGVSDFVVGPKGLECETFVLLLPGNLVYFYIPSRLFLFQWWLI